MDVGSCEHQLQFQRHQGRSNVAGSILDDSCDVWRRGARCLLVQLVGSILVRVPKTIAELRYQIKMLKIREKAREE
jgi:hypothetical protein